MTQSHPTIAPPAPPADPLADEAIEAIADLLLAAGDAEDGEGAP